MEINTCVISLSEYNEYQRNKYKLSEVLNSINSKIIIREHNYGSNFEITILNADDHDFEINKKITDLKEEKQALNKRIKALEDRNMALENEKLTNELNKKYSSKWWKL